MTLIPLKILPPGSCHCYFTGLFIMFLFLFSMPSLACVPSIDQSHVFPGTQFSATVTSSISRGQSFTVGVDGVLEGVDLSLSRQTASVAGTFTLELYLIENGTDVGPKIYSQSYDASVITAVGSFQNTWLYFDLHNAGISLRQGDQVMIALHFNDSEWIFWDATNGDQYLAGSAYYSTDNGMQWQITTNHEHGFRTYMNAGYLQGDMNGDGIFDNGFSFNNN